MDEYLSLRARADAALVKHYETSAKKQASSLSRVEAKLDGALALISELRSDNDQLKLRVADQDRVIGQLVSKVDPRGAWTWVPRTNYGVLDGHIERLWSESTPESALATPEAPVGFSSLPNELLEEIAAYLPKSDKFRFALVEFRCFDVLAQDLYSTAHLDESNAYDFLYAKRYYPCHEVGRIHRLHSTTTVFLRRRNPGVIFLLPRTSSGLEQYFPSTGPLVPVVDLSIHFASLNSDLRFWFGVLAVLDPTNVSFWNTSVTPNVTRPTSVVRHSTEHQSVKRWTHVEVALFSGAGSVPTWRSQFNNKEHLIRIPGEGLPAFTIVKRLKKGGTIVSDRADSLDVVLSQAQTIEIQPDCAWVAILVEWGRERAASA